MTAINPLHNAQFRRLFSAQLIALVGTGLSTVALTLLAYDLAGANAALVLGTALAFKMVAYVVFAPIVGGLAHRFARKPFLIAMDLVRAGIVLAMPFVNEIWQIYLLIFLLNLFSAGFKPVFAATVPDIVPDERAYTRALSMSRLAYDLENLLSPMLAGIALLFVTYTGLFAANAAAFLISALLIQLTAVPPSRKVARLGNVWREISFGTIGYFKTPRLRGLLALYLGVAAASAMVIVNTVVYVKEYLIADRPVMLFGGWVMAIGIAPIALRPAFPALLLCWFLIGLGWSLVQTPAGRVVNRSSAAEDRSAYFSAQFALSHACWLIFYPVAGQLGTRLGIDAAALWLAGAIVLFTLLASRLWPRDDAVLLVHRHAALRHVHEHVHDEHHAHQHAGIEPGEPHRHEHEHPPLTHVHPFVIDDHHSAWPSSSNP